MTEVMPVVVGRPDGGVSVRLSLREHQLLRSLPDQLRPLVSGDQAAPTVQARLYSRAYDDEEMETEYRQLIGDDTVAQRLASLDTFAETLDGGTRRRQRWSAELTDEQAGAWLSAINDARLVLGALLGISDETDWESGPSEDNPTSVAMYYLGWLEEELVGALMTSLPEEQP